MSPISADFRTSELPAAKAAAIIEIRDGHERLQCSGVQLKPNIFLTAGHCIGTRSSSKSSSEKPVLAVLTHGSTDRPIPVSQEILHPRFADAPRRHTPDFDAALLVTVQSSKQPELLAETEANPERYNQILNKSGLWLLGFSPYRLRQTQPRALISSPSAWSQIRFMQSLPREGKFLAEAVRPLSAAACRGDSGAPVWEFSQDKAALKGIVVQANCEGGTVKIAALDALDSWIQEKITRINAENLR